MQSLVILGDVGSRRLEDRNTSAPVLPSGQYQIQVHVGAKIAKTVVSLSEIKYKNYAGKLEVQTGWPNGFGGATVIEFSKLKR